MSKDSLLELLLAPTDLHTFLSGYWNRRALHQANRIVAMPRLCLADVERLIASADRPGDCLVVRHRTPVPSSTTDFVPLSAALAAYSAGCTILLTRLERRWEPVTEFCQTLQAELEHHGILLRQAVGANAYLTPCDSQAFPAHYDDHHTIILQLGGRKMWRIFEKVDAMPAHRLREQVPAERLPPLHSELALNSGDLLYIPRGIFHEAVTTPEDFSLHVTLSVVPLTWADVIAEVVTKEPLFAEAVGADANVWPKLERRLRDSARQPHRSQIALSAQEKEVLGRVNEERIARDI